MKQELTPAEEDFILESYLERVREQREVRADLLRKYGEVEGDIKIED